VNHVIEENNIFTLGIVGGTGSGKTTVANKLKKYLTKELKVTIIQQDSYYYDRSNISPHERDSINYDHPNSIDYELLLKHLSLLRNGQTINMPSYNFISHTRENNIIVIPTDVLIVEGILLYHYEKLRNCFDYRIFVDTPDDIRLIRRIERDIQERGRTMNMVKRQYIESVRPMHIEFVEPTKKFANIIIPEGEDNNVAVEMIGQSILSRFNQRNP